MKVADKKDPDETVVDGVAQAFEGQKSKSVVRHFGAVS